MRACLLILLGAAACGKVEAFVDAGADDARTIDGNADPGDAQLTVSPTSYQFGPVLVSSTSASATFTFENTGMATATGCAAPALSGANAADFTIVADSCGTADLDAGDTCTVMVSVTPSAVGVRTMTLARTCIEGGTATTVADEVMVNRPMYIFISSQSYIGNLGGLAGADQTCQALANAGTLTGPLGRTWKALLSQNTGTVVNAKDRFTWTGPVIDMANHIVTRDPSTWPWATANDNSEVGVNESGGPPDDSYVWTGSTIEGVSKGANSDCNGWTDEGSDGVSGWSGETANFPSNSWFDSFANTCGSQWFGLYCVSE